MQKLALVIPCYNEEKRLQRDVLLQWLGGHPQVEVWLIDDGSADGTAQMIRELVEESSGKIRGVFLEKNSGKAEAVRIGMLKASENELYDYIGYWDADFSTPLSEVDWMLTFSGGSFQHLFIMGTRLARLGGHIKRKPMRHYLGRIFATATSVVLGLTVYDTQCGAKFVKATEVEDIFGRPFISRWLFDVEVLARFIEKYGRQTVYQQSLEIPLTHWQEIGGSKLKMGDFMKAPLELWHIKRSYRI